MTLPEGENELKCQITTKPTVAAAASPLIVRVTNYAAITSGTTAVFELRGLFSPKKIGAFDIPVRIYE